MAAALLCSAEVCGNRWLGANPPIHRVLWLLVSPWTEAPSATRSQRQHSKSNRQALCHPWRCPDFSVAPAAQRCGSPGITEAGGGWAAAEGAETGSPEEDQSFLTREVHPATEERRLEPTLYKIGALCRGDAEGQVDAAAGEA